MEPNASAAPAADDSKTAPDISDMLVEGQDGGNPAAGESDPAAEAERAFALRMGWRDKDEHLAKGRPAHAWLDPKSYIEKQQREAPLLKSQLRKQNETIQRQEQILKEQGDALKELLDRSRGAEARGFEYALERVDAEMEEAVKNADHDGYKRLKHQREELVKMKPAPKEARKQDDPQKERAQSPDPATTAWVERNSWFSTDEEMNSWAIGAERKLMKAKPHLSTAERLEEVGEQAKKRFPEKFENAARGNPPAAARPGPQGARPPAKKAKTEADLPPSARAVMERLVRQKVLTKEQYVNDYKWDK